MVNNFKQLCDYGCGQEAKYKFKNGKYCCSEFHTACLANKKLRGLNRQGKLHSKTSKEKMRLAKLGKKNRLYGKKRSDSTKKKISKANKGSTRSETVKKKISLSTKLGMQTPEVIKKMKKVAQ